MNRYILAVPLLTLTLLVGCTSSKEETTKKSSPSPTSSAQSSSAATSAPSSSTESSTSASPQPSASTEQGKELPAPVTGKLTSNQGGCLIFTPSDRPETWVLSGLTDGLTVGTAYTLEGGMTTTTDPGCPQGPTFLITKATPVQ